MIVAAPADRGLPLLPVPCLDETFGSWLFRAAANYHMTTREFAKGVMALEHHSLPHDCDFDTRPPEGLITALTKCSKYRRSELERLIVSQTGSTLAPEHRDAYCPKCMREDRERGLIYLRRPWLDAWTFICDRHHCLLGRFEPIEYRLAGRSSSHSLSPVRPEAYRRNPSVADVIFPIIPVYNRLDPIVLTEMLKSIAGRDFVLIMGSEAANGIVYDLAGWPRLWNAVWHGASREPRGPPELEHPLGGIKTRIWAGLFATAIWRVFLDRRASHDARLKSLPGAAYSLLRPLMNRWPHSERQRFAEALKATVVS